MEKCLRITSRMVIQTANGNTLRANSPLLNCGGDDIHKVVDVRSMPLPFWRTSNLFAHTWGIKESISPTRVQAHCAYP